MSAAGTALNCMNFAEHEWLDSWKEEEGRHAASWASWSESFCGNSTPVTASSSCEEDRLMSTSISTHIYTILKFIQMYSLYLCLTQTHTDCVWWTMPFRGCGRLTLDITGQYLKLNLPCRLIDSVSPSSFKMSRPKEHPEWGSEGLRYSVAWSGLAA